MKVLRALWRPIRAVACWAWRQLDERPGVSVLVVVTIVIVAGGLIFRADNRADNARLEAIIETACATRRDDREILRALVALAGQGGPFDPAQVPGFDALEPEDQQFWLNVAALSSAGGESGFTAQALALLAGDPCMPAPTEEAPP